MTPPGIILAGGKATRMGGGDKARLLLAGQSLLDRVAARLGPQVEGLALNANGDPARFSDTGLPVIADSVAGYPGPLAGVLAGLDWAAARGAAHVVTAAADTPFLPRDLVVRLVAAARDEGARIALAATLESGRTVRHPTVGLWPVDLREDLRVALARGERKVVLWADGHGAATAVFDTARGDPFFNVNTPGDLARAEEICR